MRVGVCDRSSAAPTERSQCGKTVRRADTRAKTMAMVVAIVAAMAVVAMAVVAMAVLAFRTLIAASGVRGPSLEREDANSRIPMQNLPLGGALGFLVSHMCSAVVCVVCSGRPLRMEEKLVAPATAHTRCAAVYLELNSGTRLKHTPPRCASHRRRNIWGSSAKKCSSA